MVRAVGIVAAGGPETLALVERPVREPGPGEVRLVVRAAAVNPADVGLRRHGGRDLPPPWTPGMEAAGTVDAVGEGVDRLAVGDRVMVVVSPFRPEGGAQVERLVVPAASAVPVPDGVTLAQAATLPMNGLTARYALDLLGLAAGSTLAVTGGAGQLASYLVPLAKEHGLRVVADAAPADVELVRSSGADAVVARGEDFGAQVRAVVPGGADGLVDTALLHERAFPALRDGGVMVDLSGWVPDATERGITVLQEFVFRAFDRTDWLEEVSELAARGRFRLRVAAEVAPQDARDAHRLLEAGGLRGRAVVVF